MSLYVRVETSFYTHRKTLRLRAAIGDDAFWVPPRLWAYAAGNQPDGCFKDYSAEEIASLISYTKDATAMLQALLKAGYMDADPLRIHDWHHYNGILDFFSTRAKKAADARWKKSREQNPKQIRSEHSKAKHSRSEPSNASSIKRPFLKPQMAEVKLHCAKLGLPENDAEWFYHKCEGNGWTNNGKPIRGWASTISAWKVAGYMPSQKNGKTQPTLPGGFD